VRCGIEWIVRALLNNRASETILSWFRVFSVYD
jgi:hypothetical protein